MKGLNPVYANPNVNPTKTKKINNPLIVVKS